MWLYRFTNELLRKRWQSVLFVFVITFIPVIGTIGILVAALVTLVKGVAEGAVFTLATTLPYVLGFFLSGQELGVPLILWAAIGVISNLLTWVFAIMLRRKTSWSVMFQIAALAGVLVISIVHLSYPGVADWWGHQLQIESTKSLTVLQQNTAQSHDAQLEAINISKGYATGFVVATILINALIQLIVARWWQGVIFSRGNLSRELRAIRLSPLAGILFVMSLVFFYLGNAVVLDIMPILYALFCVAGLSLIHYLFRQMPSKTAWFWLFMLYVALIISMPSSIILVSMLALFDIWLDIRKRIKKI